MKLLWKVGVSIVGGSRIGVFHLCEHMELNRQKRRAMAMICHDHFEAVPQVIPGAGFLVSFATRCIEVPVPGCVPPCASERAGVSTADTGHDFWCFPSRTQLMVGRIPVMESWHFTRHSFQANKTLQDSDTPGDGLVRTR